MVVHTCNPSYSGGGGCRELRSHHCTPAWATGAKLCLKRKKQKHMCLLLSDKHDFKNVGRARSSKGDLVNWFSLSTLQPRSQSETRPSSKEQNRGEATLLSQAHSPKAAAFQQF
ncbi:hypothetical protein AAY473_021752 [Plecturocebus cupreus]